MTVIVDWLNDGTIPQSKTSGNWTPSQFNTGKFRFTLTFTNASTHSQWRPASLSYWGILTTNEANGSAVWMEYNPGTTTHRLLFVASDGSTSLAAMPYTWGAGTAVTVTVDQSSATAGASTMTISGASTGNGTSSGWTRASVFSGANLYFGVWGSGGFQLPAGSTTTSDIDDAGATGGAGSAGGTSTVTGVGGSIAAASGAASGSSAASAVASTDVGAGAASGTSTAQGGGASVAASTGSAAGTSAAAASVAGLEVGVGSIVQRLYSSNPATGTLSTWATDLTIGSVANATDTFTATGHGFIPNTCPGPFTLSSTGSVPAGSTAGTPYWLIIPDADTFKISASMQDAAAGTAVNLTSDGSGTITLHRTIDTQASDSVLFTSVARGVWTTDGTAATDNKTNDYTDRDDEYAYAAFPGSKVRTRVDLSAAGGAGHTVSATWGDLGGTGDEVTASLLEVKGGTLIKTFAHNEVAIGSATITAPTVFCNAEAVVVVFLWGNGPVNQDHTFTAVDGTWVKHVGASAEANTHNNGYIQCTVFTKKFSVATTGIAPQFQGITNEGAQFFVYVVQAIDPPSVGDAAGTSTATGVGVAIAAGAGSSAGAATVAAGGSSVVSGAGAASGSGTAAASGEANASATGAAAGTSTASGTGASTADATGAGGGTSTATAGGAATTAASGAATGTSTPAATGASISAGTGTSTGTSAASGTGAAVSTAAGASDGSVTVIAGGASVAAAAGAADGTSDAQGASEPSGAGSAGGTSTAQGGGATIAAATGAADGTSAAAAASTTTSVSAAAGTSAGTSAADAGGSSIAASVGAAAGTSTAVATNIPPVQDAAPEDVVLVEESVTVRFLDETPLLYLVEESVVVRLL